MAKSILSKENKKQGETSSRTCVFTWNPFYCICADSSHHFLCQLSIIEVCLLSILLWSTWIGKFSYRGKVSFSLLLILLDLVWERRPTATFYSAPVSVHRPPINSTILPSITLISHFEKHFRVFLNLYINTAEAVQSLFFLLQKYNLDLKSF